MADDSPSTLFDALPRNVFALAKEAQRAAKAGPPDYLPAILCQVGLPRSPVEGTTFERTSGTASLQLEAGRAWDGRQWQQLPIPYGIRPRLALVHITTEAIRTNSRTVDVGGSVRAFLGELGLAVSGKAYRQMREQMAALAVCTMRLGYTQAEASGPVAVTLDTKPIRQFKAWIDNEEGQRTLWPNEVELSEEFFRYIRQSAVPLEQSAIAKLTHSALALDVYAWLAHRLCRVRKGGSRISWNALQEQFGAEYADRKDFKREMKRRLRDVLAVYPAARVDEVNGGLQLWASPPPIPKTRVAVRKLPKP